MKRKLISAVLCLALLASITAPASAAFSILSVRVPSYYYVCTRPVYTPPVKCTPQTPQIPQTPETPQIPETPQAELSAFELRVVQLVNEVRAQYGLKPLEVDAELTRVARLKSQDMRDKRYFDHQSPTYGSPFDMLERFGVKYRYAGENIAMGYRTAELVMNGWMNSPGHRANILKASFTHIGVGYVADGNYWTQLFIGK